MTKFNPTKASSEAYSKPFANETSYFEDDELQDSTPAQLQDAQSDALELEYFNQFDQKIKNKFLKGYVRLSPEVLQELINKAQAGDQQALERLCRQFKPAVEATGKSPSCVSVLGKDGVSCAWVIFIELMLKTKKKVTVYFPGYIKKVLCRKLIKQITKNYKHLNCLSLDNEELQIEPYVSGFEDFITKNADLLQAFKKLNKEQQVVLYKRFYENKSYYEIAKEEGKRYQSVQAQGYRAIVQLRKALATNSTKRNL